MVESDVHNFATDGNRLATGSRHLSIRPRRPMGSGAVVPATSLVCRRQRRAYYHGTFRCHAERRHGRCFARHAFRDRERHRRLRRLNRLLVARCWRQYLAGVKSFAGRSCINNASTPQPFYMYRQELDRPDDDRWQSMRCVHARRITLAPQRSPAKCWSTCVAPKVALSAPTTASIGVAAGQKCLRRCVAHRRSIQHSSTCGSITKVEALVNGAPTQLHSLRVTAIRPP